jgi:uncharacterized protein
MHINVSHILAGEVGSEANFTFEGDSVPDVVLSQPVRGEVKVTRLDQGLALQGGASLAAELECYRCLDAYEHPMQLDLRAVYSQSPAEDEWPIGGRGEIDVTPLVRQEALVAIPLQQLCKQECLGLCDECGQKQLSLHDHQDSQLKFHNRAFDKLRQ